MGTMETANALTRGGCHQADEVSALLVVAHHAATAAR